MEAAVEIQCYTFGPFAENCYLLVGPSGKRAAVVDPGFECEPVLDVCRDRGLTVEWIVNTHAHLDHVACNRFFKDATGAPIILHPAERPLLDSLVRQAESFGMDVEPSPEPDEDFEEGRPFLFDGTAWEVIHTPGHSPGGVCLRLGQTMIVGDTLFQGSIGRTDLPGGSHEQLIASIRNKLFRLPGSTVCYPGHGARTTLDAERRDNPFVSDGIVGTIAQERS